MMRQNKKTSTNAIPYCCCCCSSSGGSSSSSNSPASSCSNDMSCPNGRFEAKHDHEMTELDSVQTVSLVDSNERRCCAADRRGVVEEANCRSAGGKNDAKKEGWGRQIDFMFSCIGYAVGLGAIWRFPYICMRNGGGAFLIPYFIFLLLCGMPLFFLELCIGQFSGLAPISVWNVCPLFKGIGWSMVVMSGIVSIYSNLIITWVLYFLAMSFTSKLPWSTCDNWWNTATCSSLNDTFDRLSGNLSVWSDNSSDASNATVARALRRMTAAEEFWQNNVLELSSGIEDLGHIRWQLLLCLFVAWLLVFLCLFKGIKSSGKVAYVTATIPYLFLTLIFIRVLLLPGAVDGILFYIKPDFPQLLNPKVWAEACLQIFYSLGPAWGGLITMASYNRFDNNCMKDAVIVCLVCCGTSFYAGFVCFSVIGHMAQSSELPIASVLKPGPGLTFIVYPEAITKLPVSPLWSIFFFLMLLTFALDSQFGQLETCTSGFVDEFPKYLKRHRTLFTAIVCALQFLVGIPLVTQAGMYMFQILDWYSAAFAATIIGFLECVVLCYIYGVNQLYKDIEMMLGRKPCLWWKLCWCLITPALMLVLLVYSCVTMVPPAYGDYNYPGWAIGFGWTVAMCSVLPMPVVAIYKICKAKGTFSQRVASLLRPTDLWVPNDGSQSQRCEHEKFNGLAEKTTFRLPWSKKIDKEERLSYDCVLQSATDNSKL